ncbi:MAG: hypothetical protein RL490_1446 [Pseudomonadota bacterium]
MSANFNSLPLEGRATLRQQSGVGVPAFAVICAGGENPPPNPLPEREGEL